MIDSELIRVALEAQKEATIEQMPAKLLERIQQALRERRSGSITIHFADGRIQRWMPNFPETPD